MIRKIEDARSLTQRASGFLIASVLSIICLATCGAYAYADTLDTSANASTATTATEASAAFTEKAGALGQGTNDLVAQDQAVGDQAGVQTGDQAGNQPAGDSTGGQAADDQAGDKTDASEDQTGDKTDVPDQATTPVNKPERAGWMQDADGSWYYYKSVNAAPSKGWIKLHKTWYYLDPADNGKMKIGKFSDGKATYIAANSGAMYAKQWVKLDSDWYYASASGALKSGWQKSGGKWYWLQADQDGAMATSAWITDKNKRYYVDGKGVMKTGWIKADEGWYYANKSGAVNQNGWVKSGSKWYWLQGDKQGLMAADQWITDKNKRYYLSGSGVMATKWIHIGDDWFYANKSGAQQNGWVKSGSKWYWLQADKQGLMLTNALQTIGDKQYSFDSNGAMRTNAVVDLDNNKVGYATSSGAIASVGVKEDGKLVLRNAQGAPLTGWQKLRAAFNHIRDDFREYNPRIPHMKSVGWETVYADDIFVRRGGNCLSCAAAMAFMAKAAGYENVYACNSGGHGWAEVDGLVYDPEWTRHNAGNYFARPYSQSGGPSYASAISSGQAWMRVAI